MGHNNPKKGFTLIELLVVIAIIAILAAILFPVFAQAREKARAISCLSNTKQLSLGFIQYEQDFDETCPNGINNYGGGNGWAGQVYTYVKSTQVFVCPDDSSNAGSALQNGDHDRASSYIYNANTNINNDPKYTGLIPSSAVTLAQFASPAKTVLLCEGANSNGYDVSRGSAAAGTSTVVGDDYYPDTGGSPSGRGVGGAYDLSGFNSNGAFPGGVGGTCGGGTASACLKYATGYLRNMQSGTGASSPQGDFQAPLGRHTGGSNYVMADGHAKFLMGAHVSGGYSNTNTDPNSTTNCGGTALAATTTCSDSSISVTFNIVQ